jgi:hypothetical protein
VKNSLKKGQPKKGSNVSVSESASEKIKLTLNFHLIFQLSIFDFYFEDQSTINTITITTTTTPSSLNIAKHHPILSDDNRFIMDIVYYSQVSWLEERMRRIGRTRPADQLGQRANLSRALKTRLQQAESDFLGAPLCILVYFAEIRVFRQFCK